MIINTYYLVRHAEKQDPNNPDTSISAVGRKRAIALKNILKDKNIKNIIVSQFIRTQQTAKPLEDTIHKTPVIIVVGSDINDNVLKVKNNLEHFSNSLVVGHTNNIPAIIKKITGDIVSIAENDYDNLFIITVTDFILFKRKKLTSTTYGVASP